MSAREADVVVVGGGLAGLAAANRAAELGARVVLLEKGAGDYPCNSRIATGVLNLAHTDPMSDPPVLRRSIADDTEGYADPALADALAATAGRALQWLRAERVQVIKIPMKGRWVLAPPMSAKPGHPWKGRGADLALDTLLANLQARGATVLFGVRARRLVLRDKKCVGLEAQSAAGVLPIHARHVVLADGGFQGNPSLVRRFISPRPECLVQRSAGTGGGDALLMAEEAGAQLTDASRFYGHLLVQDTLTNDRLWPYPTIDSLASGAIVVDRGGRRFIDEGLGGIPMANAIARREDPLGATAIFDQAIWDGAGREEFIAPNPHLEALGGTLVRADSIAALADRLGLPEGALSETVRSYNAAVEHQALASLVPERSPGRAFGELRSSPKRLRVLPVRTAPFYAIRLCAGISYTMGGIAIDAGARVLGTDGLAIPGLYAAGSCTGGLEGGPIAGYVGGLLKALVLGLRAAETTG